MRRFIQGVVKILVEDYRRRSARAREDNIYIKEYYPKTIGNKIRSRDYVNR